MALGGHRGGATGRWNHNIEYHKVVRAALGPARPAAVLDVGCGVGVLAAELAPLADIVVGIDMDPKAVGQARAEVRETNVGFVVGDFMSHPFRPASFDAVASVATLHHMSEAGALDRMAALLRPGGVLAVVGLARSTLPRDLPWELVGAVVTRILKRRHGGYWEPDTVKLWPPPSSYRQFRRVASSVLPGVRYRRHTMWRYSLVWTKPRSLS